jgi:hypothetical protein
MTNRKREPSDGPDGPDSAPLPHLRNRRRLLRHRLQQRRHYSLPNCRQEAPKLPNEFCCDALPGAKPGAPTPEVAEAVAAVKQYFEGKETDFSRFTLDLGEQDPFFGSAAKIRMLELEGVHVEPPRPAQTIFRVLSTNARPVRPPNPTTPISLMVRFNSLLGRNKFPVPLRRELPHKPPGAEKPPTLPPAAKTL